MPNTRYFSRGIESHIPDNIQSAIWKLIDDMDISPSHTQRISLTISGSAQKVVLHQEQPSYEDTQYLSVPNPVTAEICVVNDSNKTTMKLKEEYQEGI